MGSLDARARALALLGAVDGHCTAELRATAQGRELGLYWDDGYLNAVAHAAEGLTALLNNHWNLAEYVEHVAARMAEALDLVEEEQS